MKIMIVEDRKEMRELISLSLRKKGFETEEFLSGEEALKNLKNKRYLLLIADLLLPGIDGYKLMKNAKEIDPYLPVIIITAFGTVEKAVQAIKDGAFDFLTKPFDPAHLVHVVEKAIERERIFRENLILKEEWKEKFGFPEIIGESDAIKEAIIKLQKVAHTDTTVLLLGESGTGKELFARALHQLSPRRNYSFVPMNSASVPETLIENELFGHEKGAYTGAYSRKIGKLELAHKGTFFLDEIGDLNPPLQAKLLRVIEEKQFERVGGTQRIEVDARFVLATNKDLKKMVEEGKFRDDLYYRISVFPITLPPLRERKDDIPLLVQHFLRKFSVETKKNIESFSKTALEKIMNYPWPGNVRELQNCIERAVILCEGREIKHHHITLPSEISNDDYVDLSGNLKEVSKRASFVAEKKKIELTLKELDGDIKKSAEFLGVSEKTLRNKIKEFGIWKE
ncbi:MAG: sigma-54-dependent transcriptional regulator [Candidatus Aminicenantia bacterium]